MYYYCSLSNGKLFIHDLTNNLCYTLVPSKTTEAAVHFLAVFFDHVLLLKSKIKNTMLTCGNYRSTTDKVIHLWSTDRTQEEQN